MRGTVGYARRDSPPGKSLKAQDRDARYFGTYLYGLSKFENIVFILL